MKRLKKFLLPLFTLLLIAAGAAMPFAVSYMQDARQVDPDVRPFDSFSLTLQQDSDLGRVLQAFSGRNCYIQEIKEAYLSERATLTADLALEAAENVRIELVKHGLLESATPFDPQIAPQEVIPMTAYTPDGNTASVGAPSPAEDTDAGYVEYIEGGPIPTWSIFWDQSDHLYLLLDDASGKAFFIDLHSKSILENEDYYALAENWRQFVEDYYGVEAELSQASWYDSYTQFTISFSLGTSEDVFHLYLSLYVSGYTLLRPYE